MRKLAIMLSASALLLGLAAASANGTTRTSGHVRFCAAIEGTADINPAAHPSHAPVYEYMP
jgi:hypothetical protein